MSSLTTALAGINIPNISEEDLSNPQTVRQILEYLIILNRDLKFFLSHLDMDNFTAEFQQTINEATEGMTEIAQTMTNLEQGLASTRKQTAEGFQQMVTKGEFNSFAEQTAEGFEQTVNKNGIISAINQSAETIQILAKFIKIDGTSTFNNNVMIKTDGTLEAINAKVSGLISVGNGGNVGGFTINGGNLVSDGLRVGSDGTIGFGNYGSIQAGGAGFHLYSANGQFDFDGSIRSDAIISADAVFETLTVTGSKNNLVNTTNYGPRLLNAYETPEYLFGDLGEACMKNGECIIFIEPIYQETVNTHIPYHVKLTPYGDGRIWVADRRPTYFVVKGDDIPFGWEIAAKRRGYEDHRLMQPNI